MMAKTELDHSYWIELKKKTEFAGITLDDSISPSDFRIYGDRLAERQLEIFKQFEQEPLHNSVIADLGCGMGRISLPLSKSFKEVIGIDINDRILNAGREYCREASNIKFIENDGSNIPLESNSIDYIYCGGVLQHIKSLDVIMKYFNEGIRVLKVKGILNYSIQTWMDDIQKGTNIGKKISAKDIDFFLRQNNCRLLSLIEDPNDPIPHMNIVVQKLGTHHPYNLFKKLNFGSLVSKNKVVLKQIRTGIWEDLTSYSNFSKIWSGKRRKVTFWD